MYRYIIIFSVSLLLSLSLLEKSYGVINELLADGKTQISSTQSTAPLENPKTSEPPALVTRLVITNDSIPTYKIKETVGKGTFLFREVESSTFKLRSQLSIAFNGNLWADNDLSPMTYFLNCPLPKSGEAIQMDLCLPPGQIYDFETLTIDLQRHTPSSFLTGGLATYFSTQMAATSDCSLGKHSRLDFHLKLSPSPIEDRVMAQWFIEKKSGVGVTLEGDFEEFNLNDTPYKERTNLWNFKKIRRLD